MAGRHAVCACEMQFSRCVRCAYQNSKRTRSTAIPRGMVVLREWPRLLTSIKVAPIEIVATGCVFITDTIDTNRGAGRIFGFVSLPNKDACSAWCILHFCLGTKKGVDKSERREPPSGSSLLPPALFFFALAWPAVSYLRSRD